MLTTVVDTNATRVAIAEARARVGKRLFYAPADTPTDAWRPDDERAGKWVKPKDIGQGADTNIGKNYQWRLYDTDTHKQRLALRKLVASDVHKCMILGLPNEENLARFTPQADHLLCPYGQFTRGKSAFRDTPRAWLTMDVDGLDLRKIDADVDVHADADRMQDLLRDALDDMGLDWLIADCIIQFSSTHGLHSTHHLKAHVEWRLAQPLTVAQQKFVAGYCNQKSQAAGYGEVFDTVIYNINRVFFTATPELLKRVWVPDQGILNMPMAHPYKGARVQHAIEGIERVDLADDVYALFDKADRVRRVRKLTGAAPATTFKLEPGNVWNAVRGTVMATASRTRIEQADATIRQLQAQLEAGIRAMPDSVGEQLESRLAYVTLDEIRRSYEGALLRAQYYDIGSAAPLQARHPIAPARAALKSDLQAKVDAGVEYYRAAPADNLITDPPTHSLIKVPPGVGKTHAALAAIGLSYLSLLRIVMLTPTARLSEEAVERVLLETPESFHDRVRHHRGRAQQCKNEELNKIAERVEALGISPLATVCAKCPLRAECPWPKQREDKGSGLVVMQHAHATSSLAQLGLNSDAAPALTIVDESMMGTLLQSRFMSRPLSQLREITNGALLRRKNHSIRYEATADLRQWRSKALALIETNQHTIPQGQALSFWRDCRKSTDRYAYTLAEDAEHDLQRALRKAIELYTAQEIETKEKRFAALASDAANALKASQFFEEFYRALRLAAHMPERDHVYGARISASKSLSLQLRADLPNVMRSRHTIWMDGTANNEVWAATLGPHEKRVQHMEIKVQPGAYRLTQFADMAYAKSMFRDSQRANSNLARLKRFLLWLAAQHREVLFVAQLDVTRALKPHLPANVAIEHFNNIRGVDKYRYTPCAVIVGRPLPPVSELTLMAEALWYDDSSVTRINPDRMRRTKRTIALTGNKTATIEAEAHPDRHIELLRQQICDAEVRQAVNRLRVYDRGADNPAHLYVFGQADTGLPVHELRAWKDAEREPADIIAASGIWTASPDIAARLGYALLDGHSERHIKRAIETAPDLTGWTSWLITYSGASRRRRIWTDPQRIEQTSDGVAKAMLYAAGITVTAQWSANEIDESGVT